MWVLSADRAELHFFPTPEQVPDGYAALSHVWDKEEQSFQDVRKIQETCATNGTNPRDVVCAKIRRCCRLAESHGYKWVWMDTCCIDKTSSAELSEAINSMFRYYSLARICYGYLRDVRHRPLDPDAPRLNTRSVWFSRGWTLQELIAPRFFLFVSQDWQVLGCRADFAELLEDKINIPAAVLRLEASHTQYSISQRMSWFGERETTRPEDEAYCLLGLFDIHLPPLYGEGRNAFRRLQEEIMKQSEDTTLFAWDPVFSMADDQSRSCLFAPSPSAFQPNHIAYAPQLRAQQWHHRRFRNSLLDSPVEGVADMTFTVTPHGVQAYIPIIEYSKKTYADLSWSGDASLSKLPNAQPSRFLLCLEKDPDSQVWPGSPRRPSYIVCYSRVLQIIDPPQRVDKYVFEGRTVHASWQTVLIRHRLPPPRLPGQLLQLAHSHSSAPWIPPMPLQFSLGAPFRFDEAHIRKFLQQSRAGWVEVRNAGFPEHPTGAGKPSHHPNPTTYTFIRQTLYKRAIVIRVGECPWERKSSTPSRPAPLWATVSSITVTMSVRRGSSASMNAQLEGLSRDARHCCLEDHVLHWPDSRKQFDLDIPYPESAAVTLSFTRCPINPARTLVLDASFHGRHEGPWAVARATKPPWWAVARPMRGPTAYVGELQECGVVNAARQDRTCSDASASSYQSSAVGVVPSVEATPVVVSQ